MNRSLTLLAGALAASAVVGGGAASAQEGPPAGPAWSLEDALAATFNRDPQLALAAERVATQRASLDEALGLFDRKIGLRTGVDYRVQELFGGRLRSERDRRLRLEIPPPEFDRVAEQLIARLPIGVGEDNPGSLLFPDCDQATSFFVLRDDDGALQSVLCFDSEDNLIGILGNPANQSDVFNAFNLGGLFNDLSAIDEELDDFVEVQLGLAADTMRQIALALRQAAATLRLQRVRIGELPEDVETIKFEMGVDWQHRFRGGSRLVSTVDFVSNEDNFRGKRLSPSFGDSFAPNTFTATFGVALDVPLGKGGGKVSAEAPVRAAEQNLLAAEALYAHVASERALDTLEAYWDVAAATRRLALLEDSLVTQGRLLEAGEQLVAGDAIPAVDLLRNRARLAEVGSQVAAARQALAIARLELVRTTGVDGAAIEAAPVAAQGLEVWIEADPIGAAPTEEVVARGLGARRDVVAATALTEANATLAAAAKADLRPETTLSLRASYNALHESFRDRFYDFEGFQRALDDQFAGPSYGLSIRVRLPVGNHAARGRLLQAEVSTDQSRITEGDLRRAVRLRLHELAANVALARQELQGRREALAATEESHRGSVERYQAGDLSVIDTLLTEEQLTAARLQVVDAERRYLSLVAQLRFEAGALVEAPTAAGESVRLAPLAAPML